jgi:hypothetical protein
MASVEPGASSAIWRGVGGLASLVRYTVTSGSTATRADTPTPGSSSTATKARRPYRDGQEDQLGALGFALNAPNTSTTPSPSYAPQITDEDLRRLSPLQHEHINMLGHFPVTLPDELVDGHRRQLGQLVLAA